MFASAHESPDEDDCPCAAKKARAGDPTGVSRAHVGKAEAAPPFPSSWVAPEGYDCVNTRTGTAVYARNDVTKVNVSEGTPDADHVIETWSVAIESRVCVLGVECVNVSR
jgi:hypothetical protein